MRVNKYLSLKNEDGTIRIVKECTKNFKEIDSINSPQKICDLMNSIFLSNQLTEEHVYLLCIDSKLKLIGIFHISQGTVNYCVANNREIFQKALLCNAASIIIVHNHPSGDTHASKDDIRTCEKIKEGGQLMNVALLDFLVIGGNDYLSFKERGLM